MAQRFQFSLKSLVVVVSFAAVLLGWWSDHWRLRQRIEELEELDAPLIRRAIPSGAMVDPMAPPMGISRFRPEAPDSEAPDETTDDALPPRARGGAADDQASVTAPWQLEPAPAVQP